jgi:hypothetical protein
MYNKYIIYKYLFKKNNDFHYNGWEGSRITLTHSERKEVTMEET